MESLQSYGAAYLVNCSRQMYGFQFYCFSHQEATQFAHPVKGYVHKSKNIQIKLNNFMTFKGIHVVQGQLEHTLFSFMLSIQGLWFQG